MYTNNGCSRLVDYYFVVTCAYKGINHIKKKLQNASLAPESETQPRHATFALKPKIVNRYPFDNYSDTPLGSWIARISMPRGVRARTLPPAPKFFTFVGWNTDGSKLYASCVEVFEKIAIHNQHQTVYIPKTIGFISHYPYFCLFEVFLRCLLHAISSANAILDLEKVLMHYFYDIPAPSPKKQIKYDLGPKKQILLACRNEYDVQISELSQETVFTQLSKDRICFILKLLLLEKRIIFICGDGEQLTAVCELFVSLLFPFRWKHLYMPLLSRNMFSGISPNKYSETSPFIVGLPKFLYLNPDIQKNMPRNSYLVFLDKNKITDYKKRVIHPNKIGDAYNLPKPLENQLKDAIHTLARILTMQVDVPTTPHNRGKLDLTSSVSVDYNKSPHSHNHLNHTRYQPLTQSNPNPYNYNHVPKLNQQDLNNLTLNRDNGNDNEYIIEAFRTMFVVMTKLLYLSSNRQYANANDLNNKHKHNKFIISFRNTLLFQSFHEYYLRINGAQDPNFKKVYKFFKVNEGHGKNFAKRNHNPFDRFNKNVYDIKDTFRVSKDKMNALESIRKAGNSKIGNKKRKRQNKYSYPIKEFRMNQKVKTYLSNYVWKEGKSHHKIRRKSSGVKSHKSHKSHIKKPKILIMDVVDNNKKDINNITNGIVKGNLGNAQSLSLKSTSKSTSMSLSVSIITKKRQHSKGRHHKSKHNINKNKNDNNNLHEEIEKFMKDLMDNKESDKIEKRLELCLEIEKKCQIVIRRNIKMDSDGINAATIDVGYKPQTFTHFTHWKQVIFDEFKQDVGSKSLLIDTYHVISDKYKSYKKDLQLISGVVRMLEDQLSLHGSVPDDFFKPQNSQSLSDDNGSTSGSGSSWDESSGSSSSSSSSSTWNDDDNSNFDDIDENKNVEPNSGSGSSLHFRKLNEFELQDFENEIFDKCEQQHNQLIGGDIGNQYIQSHMYMQYIIGSDLVNDYIIKKWTKNHVKSKSKSNLHSHSKSKKSHKNSNGNDKNSNGKSSQSSNNINVLYHNSPIKISQSASASPPTTTLRIHHKNGKYYGNKK